MSNFLFKSPKIFMKERIFNLRFICVFISVIKSRINTHILCLFHRYLLRVVVRCDHAEHQFTQS